MPTRNVNLTEHLARFIDQQVQIGCYQNASEVVREALRHLEADLGAARAHTDAVHAIRLAAERGLLGRSDQEAIETTLRHLALPNAQYDGAPARSVCPPAEPNRQAAIRKPTIRQSA